MSEDIQRVVEALSVRLDRLPTEVEVEQFIMGDLETRMRIWNSGELCSNPQCPDAGKCHGKCLKNF